MWEQKRSSKNVFSSIWLSFVLLVLLGSLCPSCAADTTYSASDYSVVNGTYLSGSIPTSLQNIDADYFTVESAALSTSSLSYNPTSCTPSGGATYISGSIGDLASSNDVHMVYRSYPSVTSAQALFAHQEVTTIAGSTYNIQRPESADMPGISLPASMAVVGRQLWGRFVYPLSGLSSIPSSSWTANYRAWRDPDPIIAYDSVGSGHNGDGASNITWSHVVGSGANRFMAIGISIRDVAIEVSNVTVGGQLATFLRSDVRSTDIRGEIWYLINPDSGPKTVTVALSGLSKASGGSVSYSGVAQTSPVDNHASASYGGVTPSVSLTTTTNNDWIFANLAICGTATISVHGSGQVHRYYQIGTGGGGSSRAGADGDDKTTTTAGLYTMAWNMSWADTIAQAVAFKPAPQPVGHADVDVLIRKSDGTVRAVLATGVANSGDLSSTSATLSGMYSMATYSVVDQADYLEIDYYVDVALATSGIMAHLRICDNTVPAADQTRMANVMLPSEYTVEVEFAGSSNTFTWTQINWTVETSWSTGLVATTLQLYDFALGGYSTSGDGFISYMASAVANTDETKTQPITVNPRDFRDSTGYWRMKVKGVKASNTPFDFRGDWIELKSTYNSEYAASTEFLFFSIANNTMVQLNFTVVSEYSITDVAVTVQVWNYLTSAYVEGGQGYLKYTASDARETRLLSLDISQQFYVSNGSARIRVASLTSAIAPYQQRIDQVKLDCKNAATAIIPSLFTWPAVLLVALPLPVALLFFWFLASRHKNNAKSLILGKSTAFSKQFGMTHEQMVGKKILLEVDPASDYIIALSGFASEAKKNGESLFIVTNQNSALHSMFPSTQNANFFLLTSKTHYPQEINQKETLLPASDVSVLLNACVKAQEAHHDKTINLLFDNISDIILRCGSDKTYQFIRLLLEALSKSKATALFVFIPTAHDQEAISSIRGLFQIQLKYTKEGPKA